MHTIVEDMKVFKKYFNNIRIVDPLLKRVIYYEEPLNDIGKKESADNQSENNKNYDADKPDDSHAESCFEVWKTGDICENCISIRAISAKKILFKPEVVGKKVYLVIAIPVQCGQRTVALELLNDVTGKSDIENYVRRMGQSANSSDIHASIVRREGGNEIG